MRYIPGSHNEGFWIYDNNTVNSTLGGWGNRHGDQIVMNDGRYLYGANAGYIYGDPHPGGNSSSDYGVAAGVLIALSIIAMFNNCSSSRPVSYIGTSSAYSTTNQIHTPANPPIEELKSIRNSDARDFYTQFMDYKNTDALFAQFKLQRYSDENPVNPETGIAPLSPKISRIPFVMLLLTPSPLMAISIRMFSRNIILLLP